MPRLPRFDLVDVPQHVVQRGNNRTPCFFADADRLLYLTCMRDAARENGVAIHAYVLMTNHVHMLATPLRPHAVSAMMQTLGRRYVRLVNQRHSRTGTLWEGRFKACLVDSDHYVLATHRYIDLNPVRAGIVRDPADYRWSSYGAHAGSPGEPWLRPHDCYVRLGSTPAARAEAYRELCATAMESAELVALRTATSACLVYGSEAFKDRVALSVDRPVRRSTRNVTGTS